MPADPPDQPDLLFVRLVWIDSAGIRRARLVPASKYGAAKAHGVGLNTGAAMALPVWGDVCAPDAGIGAVGEVRLVAEEASLRRLPWHPHHAVALADLHSFPGTPADVCPRSALRRTLAQADVELGVTFQVGFETEFLVLHRAAAAAFLAGGAPAGPVALDRCSYAHSNAVDGAAGLLDEVALALYGLGLDLDQLHAESAHGQFEVVHSHAPALQAADGLVLAREAIHAAVSRHVVPGGGGREQPLMACLLPKFWGDQAGSGCHAHISLWRGGCSLMCGGSGQGGLDALAEAWAAGLLAHLPALLAFTLPCTNSYARITPATWAGAYRLWGHQNKEAPLRLCETPLSPDSTNLEFKALDNTANPYIALAAVITAGLAGVRAGAQLPPPCNEDPAFLSAKAMRAAGIERLPTSLTEALVAYDKDAELQSALEQTLGGPLLTAFLAVRRSERAHFAGKSFQEEVAALYDRY